MRGLIPSQFGGNSGHWVGRVEDRADPQMRGRLRVRIFGYHTEDTTLIPTSSLPWAIVTQDITSAALGGVGSSPTGAMEGTFVLGIWADGDDMQMPIVLGSLGPIEGITSSYGGPGGNGAVNGAGVNDSYNGLPGNVVFSEGEPSWLSIARAEIGVKEYAGSQHNPRIMEYHSTVGISSSDETAWCSSFIAWCLKQAGLSYAGATGMAKSWATASSVQRISEPARGCIAVFNRPPDPKSGHVGFVDAIQGGSLMLIHGNAGNKVDRTGKSQQQLIGFYWPVGQPMDQYKVQSTSEGGAGPVGPEATEA